MIRIYVLLALFGFLLGGVSGCSMDAYGATRSCSSSLSAEKTKDFSSVLNRKELVFNFKDDFSEKLYQAGFDVYDEESEAFIEKIFEVYQKRIKIARRISELGSSAKKADLVRVERSTEETLRRFSSSLGLSKRDSELLLFVLDVEEFPDALMALNSLYLTSGFYKDLAPLSIEELTADGLSGGANAWFLKNKENLVKIFYDRLDKKLLTLQNIRSRQIKVPGVSTGESVNVELKDGASLFGPDVVITGVNFLPPVEQFLKGQRNSIIYFQFRRFLNELLEIKEAFEVDGLNLYTSVNLFIRTTKGDIRLDQFIEQQRDSLEYLDRPDKGLNQFKSWLNGNLQRGFFNVVLASKNMVSDLKHSSDDFRFTHTEENQFSMQLEFVEDVVRELRKNTKTGAFMVDPVKVRKMLFGVDFERLSSPMVTDFLEEYFTINGDEKSMRWNRRKYVGGGDGDSLESDSPVRSEGVREVIPLTLGKKGYYEFSLEKKGGAYYLFADHWALNPTSNILVRLKELSEYMPSKSAYERVQHRFNALKRIKQGSRVETLRSDYGLAEEVYEIAAMIFADYNSGLIEYNSERLASNKNPLADKIDVDQLFSGEVMADAVNSLIRHGKVVATYVGGVRRAENRLGEIPTHKSTDRMFVKVPRVPVLTRTNLRVFQSDGLEALASLARVIPTVPSFRDSFGASELLAKLREGICKRQMNGPHRRKCLTLDRHLKLNPIGKTDGNESYGHELPAKRIYSAIYAMALVQQEILSAESTNAPSLELLLKGDRRAAEPSRKAIEQFINSIPSIVIIKNRHQTSQP